MHLHEDVEGDEMKKYVNQIDRPVKHIYGEIKKNRYISIAYTIAALSILGIMSYVVSLIFNGVGALQLDNGVHLLVLFGIFGLINFFFLMFLWFISESSYYREEQQWAELWLYLKGEDPLDDLKEKKKRYE